MKKLKRSSDPFSHRDRSKHVLFHASDNSGHADWLAGGLYVGLVGWGLGSDFLGGKNVWLVQTKTLHPIIPDQGALHPVVKTINAPWKSLRQITLINQPFILFTR